jgi:hypothetical protein
MKHHLDLDISRLIIFNGLRENANGAESRTSQSDELSKAGGAVFDSGHGRGYRSDKGPLPSRPS